MENDKFDTVPESETSIISASGRDFISLSKETKTLKFWYKTVWDSNTSEI